MYIEYLAHSQQVHVHAVHEDPVGLRIPGVPTKDTAISPMTTSLRLLNGESQCFACSASMTPVKASI